MMSLNMLIEFGDAFDFTGADFRTWCNQAGFRSVEVIPLASAASTVIAYRVDGRETEGGRCEILRGWGGCRGSSCALLSKDQVGGEGAHMYENPVIMDGEKPRLRAAHELRPVLCVRLRVMIEPLG